MGTLRCVIARWNCGVARLLRCDVEFDACACKRFLLIRRLAIAVCLMLSDVAKTASEAFGRRPRRQDLHNPKDFAAANGLLRYYPHFTYTRAESLAKCRGFVAECLSDWLAMILVTMESFIPTESRYNGGHVFKNEVYKSEPNPQLVLHTLPTLTSLNEGFIPDYCHFHPLCH